MPNILTMCSQLVTHFISLTSSEEVIPDATRNEKAPANHHSLLKPRELRCTRLEIRGGREVVLLVRDVLFRRPTGKHVQNLRDRNPVQYIDESAIIGLHGSSHIEFTDTIWPQQQPVATTRKHFAF